MSVDYEPNNFDLKPEDIQFYDDNLDMLLTVIQPLDRMEDFKDK